MARVRDGFLKALGMAGSLSVFGGPGREVRKKQRLNMATMAACRRMLLGIVVDII